MLESGYRLSPLLPWPKIRLSADDQPLIRIRWTLSGARMELKSSAGWAPFPEEETSKEAEESVVSAAKD